jgi:hypothetical protein
MDKTFWIGAGVGLISALLGVVVSSWLQFKFRLKELDEIRKQQQIDQEREKLSQEEALRKELMSLITDLRTDKEFIDYMKKTINRRSITIEYYPRTSSVFHSLAYADRPYKIEDWLEGMSLVELKNLHVTLLSLTGLFPISEMVNQQEDEIKRITNEIFEMLRKIPSTATQPINPEFDKK